MEVAKSFQKWHQFRLFNFTLRYLRCELNGWMPNVWSPKNFLAPSPFIMKPWGSAQGVCKAASLLRSSSCLCDPKDQQTQSTGWAYELAESFEASSRLTGSIGTTTECALEELSSLLIFVFVFVGGLILRWGIFDAFWCFLFSYVSGWQAVVEACPEDVQ